MRQLKSIWLFALILTALPVALRQGFGALAGSRIIADDNLIKEKLIGNGVKFTPQEITTVSVQKSVRVRTPIAKTWAVVKEAPVVRLLPQYRYKIEVSQECRFKVAVAEGSDCKGLFDILFSKPPIPPKDPEFSTSMHNLWEHVVYEVMKPDRDHSIDPTAWSFKGDVLLTLWIEPRQQWYSPKGHIMFKGRSIPLPFEYVTMRQNGVVSVGKRVTQVAFDYKQEDDISAVKATVTITPIAKNR